MFLKRITVLFYVTIIMFVGAALVLFALNFLNFADWQTFSYICYTDPDLRMIVGIIGVIILFSNFLFYRYFSVNVHRDKIIAFDNPSGRVSVSLMAMEDLVRRKLTKSIEIKDARVKITAAKKGLDVRIRLTMRSESNIPDLTSKIQDQVVRNITDIIGIDEKVDVSVYVNKILSEKIKRKVIAVEDEENSQEPDSGPAVPFRGYGRGKSK